MPPPEGETPGSFRKVAIIGAGAMGCSLAGMLGSTVRTVMVVRDDHRAQRLRSHGIEVSGALQARCSVDVYPTIDALDAVDGIDLVFIATKTTSIPTICRALAPYRQRLPYLCAYQNGLVAGEQFVRELAFDRVLRMVANYGAQIVAERAAGDSFAGVRVRIGLHQPPHVVGGIGESSARVASNVAQLLSRAGLPTCATDNIERHVWRKGILNAATNPVAALLAEALDHLVRSPAAALIRKLLIESIEVATAAGVDLGRDFAAQAMQRLVCAGSHMPSMALDLLAGRETELGQLNRHIAGRGRELGVATPSHDAVCALIDTFDWRARGSPDLGLVLMKPGDETGPGPS